MGEYLAAGVVSAAALELGDQAANVLELSARRDAELARRLAAFGEGYGKGQAEGFEAGYRAALEWVAEGQREACRVATEAARRPEYAALELARWHRCCLPCRRGGHRSGCERCEDRTRADFGTPHPDDYMGGPVAWVPAAGDA